MIMNFWKVLMESITAKQRQKGQNVHTGTHWFDVSQDTSKVVVPMAHPSQHGTEVGVQGDTIAQTKVSVEGQAQVDSVEQAPISVQVKDTVESESDESNTIYVLSGAVHCAVEAFARFGRADMLAQLVKEHPVHKEIEYLVGSLGDFSEAAHLCKGDDMDFAVHAIRQGIKDCESITANSEVDTAFLQYLPTLKESLGDLLDTTVHSQELQLAMIQWCLQCGLYQQSVTLSTEWVPTILFNKGVYYTDRTEKRNRINATDLERMFCHYIP